LFKKGDIILPVSPAKRCERLSDLFHPAVVWDNRYDGESDFKGIILTSSNKFENNIALQEQHFHSGYEIGYNNSHFINQVYYKFGKWGPFEKVGQLTKEGVCFIEENLICDSAIPFVEYIKQLNKK